MHRLIICHYVSNGTRFFSRTDINIENGNHLSKLDDLKYYVPAIFKIKPPIQNISDFDHQSYVNQLIVNINPQPNNKKDSKISLKKILNNRKVDSIIALLRKNNRPNDIYKFLNLERKLVYRVYNKYKKDSVKMIRQSENNSNINYNNSYNVDNEFIKTKKSIFSVNIQEKLKLFLSLGENKFKTIKMLKKDFEQYYHEQFQERINFHKNTYHKNLTSKNKLNFSLKKTAKYSVYFNNNRQLKLERIEFAKKFLFLKSNRHEFIFIDEFAISFADHPNYGWGPKGIKPEYSKIICKKPRLSVICAFTVQGIINYQVFEGSARGSDYSSFLFNMIRKNDLINSDYILICDNARIHKNKLLPKIEKYLNILFLPAYSPQLNPIETLFSVIKTRLRRGFYEDYESLIQNLRLCINSIEDRVLQSLVNKLYKNMNNLFNNIQI